MNSFAPEFAQHWIAASADRSAGGQNIGDDDVPSPSQQEALDALAERVSAARSTL